MKYKSLRALFRDSSRWLKYSYSAYNRFCLLAGIDEVYGNNLDLATKVESKIAIYIKNNYPKIIEGYKDSFETISFFNDSKMIGHQDILKVIRSAKV